MGKDTFLENQFFKVVRVDTDYDQKPHSVDFVIKVKELEEIEHLGVPTREMVPRLICKCLETHHSIQRHHDYGEKKPYRISVFVKIHDDFDFFEYSLAYAISYEKEGRSDFFEISLEGIIEAMVKKAKTDQYIDICGKELDVGICVWTE